MKASLCPFSNMSHQRHWLDLLGQGLMKHGIRIEWCDQGQKPSGDFVAAWGWRRASIYRNQGYRVLVLERGYIGDRFKWTSVGWDGLNNRAKFCLDRVPGDRAERWLELLKPLRRSKPQGSVLLAGQVPGDSSIQHINIDAWYRQVVDALREAGFSVAFRPHPVVVQRGRQTAPPGVHETTGDLASDLAAAAGVVTFNSNLGVDAVLAGVPTIAMDAGSMVYGLVPTTLPFKQITERQRKSWLKRLAYCQWSEAELASGECWAHIGKGING